MTGTAAHRKDIDGLRSVAILPVLFFHAGIPPFAAGYVGVDVFFVLSGYLITGLILRAQEGSGFSLRDFYDRRVRRILPALFTVLAAATLVAPFILLPDELIRYGKSLLGSVLFYANIIDWLRGRSYFDTTTGQNPLLHIWSLAVEEQFYLFWPLALMGLARFRRWLPAVIAVLGVLSLGLAVLFRHIDSNISFFLLPTRAWELLGGAFLAANAFSTLRQRALRHAAALIGVVLIAAAATMPGRAAGYHVYNAFGATLGTMAILYVADGGSNLVSAVLATRVPVFIGLISYSLYLWHWPMLVYARLYANRDLTGFETGAVLLAAFAASILSWRFIEQPLRRQAGLWRGMPASFPVAASAAIPLLAVAVFFLVSEGLPSRVAPQTRAIYAEGTAEQSGTFCEPGDASANCARGAFKDEAVLWGDSHARMMAPGLFAFAAERHLTLRQFSRSACPPLPGLLTVDEAGAVYSRCGVFNRAVLDGILTSPHVRLVILHARWEILFNEGRIATAGSPAAAFSQALGRLLDTLAAHHIAVLVIGNTPLFSQVPAHCYAREAMLGRNPAPCVTEPWSTSVGPLVASERLLFQAVVPRTRLVRYHPAFADLCDGATGCHAFSAGHSLFIDDNHLSPAGAAIVGQRLDAALRNWPR
jgi:peptidoglycan/LPS O-acetylase OafA/YrhL